MINTTDICISYDNTKSICLTVESPEPLARHFASGEKATQSTASPGGGRGDEEARRGCLLSTLSEKLVFFFPHTARAQHAPGGGAGGLYPL